MASLIWLTESAVRNGYVVCMEAGAEIYCFINPDKLPSAPPSDRVSRLTIPSFLDIQG